MRDLSEFPLNSKAEPVDGQEISTRFPTTLRHMSDTAELETEEPPIGQATIVYLGPAAVRFAENGTLADVAPTLLDLMYMDIL